eukprot:352884-Chlamydomonas_euryale.AAC.9
MTFHDAPRLRKTSISTKSAAKSPLPPLHPLPGGGGAASLPLALYPTPLPAPGCRVAAARPPPPL